jgi:hypothetical protein
MKLAHPLTGSNTVGDPSVPGRDMTYTVWRRIVNNLPLLLKSQRYKTKCTSIIIMLWNSTIIY